MDPMDWLENHELLRFFRRHKTEMSCMEKPRTFLCQLRDHDLVPEDRYKKVSCMRSKDNMRKGLYEILDWFERERSQKVREFWSCVFKDSILNQYPTLRLLRNSLMDGSFHFDISEKVGKEESDKGKRKALSDSEKEEEEEEEQEKSVTKKRKLRSRSVCRNEEEPAGPSSQLTPRKRSKKLCFYEEREERAEQQPQASHDKRMFRVTCGASDGTLYKKRFASGTRGKSIRTETSWMTPVEFLELALGRKDASWKKDIECEGKPLFVLIKAKTLRIHSLLCNCSLCKPDDEDQRNQKNDDECCICRREGDLVMCDNCPRSFHKKCHLPHVENGLLRDNSPWFCTFCVFRSNEHYFGSEELESALSYNISQRMLLNDYSDMIETPMWFGHIAGKLQQKLYQTVGEFVTDVRLIFSNCALYNRENAEVLVKGNRLKELFDRTFKSVFNIK